MNSRSPLSRCLRSIAVVFAAAAVHGTPSAADIDIYGIQGSGSAPNVLFFIDNTANWSGQDQLWIPSDSWDRCKTLDATSQAECQAAIKTIFYVGPAAGKTLPWDPNWKKSDETYWNSNKVPQGVIEARVLKLVLKALVCDAAKPLSVNVGLSMFTPAGSVRSNSDLPAFIYHAVQRLTGPSDAGTCKTLLKKLDDIDANVNSPEFKVSSNADYGSIFYEVFKYFGGYTNPTLAETTGAMGTPVGAQGYGSVRFSKPNKLDDKDAYEPLGSTSYKSPISASNACGKNFLVLIGNGYPNAEIKTSPSPVKFSGLNYDSTATPLSKDILSDKNTSADDWSYFLWKTDVSNVDGIQPVFTYAVNVFNRTPDPDQARLLKSIAKYGGVGGSAYVEVGGDLYKLVKAFEGILYQVSADASVFAATTLPVSTTTQGTYLNQVFVGMFRPDAQASPRWLGNLKEYQLGFDSTGVLELQDAKSKSAVLGDSGFFAPLAESFWTKESVFFTNRPLGTQKPESDLPDGAVVEKGGVAQWLRENNLTSAAGRTVFTLPSSPPSEGTELSKYKFDAFNSSVSSQFASDPKGAAAAIAWVRGEANVADGLGAEAFVGSYVTSGTVKDLGTTGARPSIHGDVLHSRPVAINYGSGDIVVFYGGNDGFLRAIDGRKSAGGSELWSFIAPEHYDTKGGTKESMMQRLRAGYPRLHLPETDSSGNTILPLAETAPKEYAFDGPLGAFVRYAAGGASVTEAIIFASMRRGGDFVYAFDVKERTNPKFLWKIKKGETADFGNLAQTWSMAKPIVYGTTSDDPPVVVMMGGGYDPVEDTLLTGSSAGSSIYFVNGRTGALLKEVKIVDKETGTSYSMPSDVTVVDLDGNGIPDRVYAVDVRGNVFRIDLPSVTPATSQGVLKSATWDSTGATKIAELSGKAFYAPDVVVTSEFVAVLVGTGDREKPLLTSKKWGAASLSTEGFFMIKDTKRGQPPRSSPLQVKDLAHIAKVTINEEPKSPAYKRTSIEAVTSTSGHENGCYMTLASDGEKVVNAPATIAGVAYFGTNRPTPTLPGASALSCKANLGEAYAYKFPLFCKLPTRTQLSTGGLPPSPVTGIVIIDVGGTPTQVPFVIGGGAGGSPFSPEQPKPNVPSVRKRTFWHIDNANR